MKSLTGALLIGVLALSSCDDSAVIASESTMSPNGALKAIAKTVQSGGPGTAALYVEVSIARATAGEGHSQTILLLNESKFSWADKSKKVSLVWPDSEHLIVRYPKEATVEFQAIRAYGIEISAQIDGAR